VIFGLTGVLFGASFDKKFMRTDAINNKSLIMVYHQENLVYFILDYLHSYAFSVRNVVHPWLEEKIMQIVHNFWVAQNIVLLVVNIL